MHADFQNGVSQKGICVFSWSFQRLLNLAKTERQKRLVLKRQSFKSDPVYATANAITILITFTTTTTNSTLLSLLLLLLRPLLLLN